VAQEHAKGSSAAGSEPFTGTQRQQIQLQQLFELLFALALRLTLTISSSKGPGRQESQPVALQVTLSHAAPPLKEQELQPLALNLTISLTSTNES
jgi:hypothetical protein